MRPLSAYDLLGVWEAGEDRHPLDRALILLAVAYPELTWEELAELSVGERDACLLALRERAFGPTLSGFAECSHCAERLEFDVAVADLRVGVEPREAVGELVTDGLALHFRLPTSRDLAAVVGCRNPDTGRSTLVRRCVLRATRDGVPVDHSRLSAEAIATLAERMAECDPQAEVLLALRCPTCEHSWRVLFDIVAFFWTELAAEAKRLLGEVHTLARAYGWREADILGMSARRRRFYLEVAT